MSAIGVTYAKPLNLKEMAERVGFETACAIISGDRSQVVDFKDGEMSEVVEGARLELDSARAWICFSVSPEVTVFAPGFRGHLTPF